MPPLDPNQKAKDMQQFYRNVFSTPEGRIVLGDILALGHFGEPLDPTNPIVVAENNVAIIIARQAGAFDVLWQQFGMTEGD